MIFRDFQKSKSSEIAKYLCEIAKYLREIANTEMKETSVTLQEFSVSNGDGSHSAESPLIVAARNGDAQEIRKILQEKDPQAQDEEEPLYPDDWKYHFKDLLLVDSEGRTALHIAASIGNEL